MQLPPNTQLQGGKYRIIRYISRGGFGCTYEAELVLLHKRVAIKEFFVRDFCNRDSRSLRVTVGTHSKSLLVDRLKNKFLEEAGALYGMHDAHIVRVTDVFEENGTAYYVMDYIDGMSLFEKVKRQGKLPEREAVDYIKQVAGALKTVHSLGRLHLDIKPGNIMVNSKGQAILIDFGASKQYDEVDGENTSTLLGKTPGYAPVEQMSNRVQKFSPATDIYSLGATMYKLLTGVTPPDAADLASGDTRLAPLPSTISSSVRNAVKKAMSLRRIDRQQNVDQFIAQITYTPPVKPVVIKPVVIKPVEKSLWQKAKEWWGENIVPTWDKYFDWLLAPIYWLLRPLVKLYDWLDRDLEAFVGAIIMLLVFSSWGIIFLLSLFDTESPKIQRIQVGDKYGIGYDAENLLVEAKYDSIKTWSYYDQWLLYNTTDSLWGVAYVTDSISRIIEPSYKMYDTDYNNYVLLKQADESIFVCTKGIIRNEEPYKRVTCPGYLGSTKCLIATRQDGLMQILNDEGLPVNDIAFWNIVVDKDSVIRAIRETGVDSNGRRVYVTDLYDYDGNMTCGRGFHSVYEFTDGVAWCMVENSDREGSCYSLIDRKGQVLFKLPADQPNSKRGSKVYKELVPFGEGIGFYSSTYYGQKYQTWHAIDRTGRVVFDIEKAYKVFPATLGLIPVVKGERYKVGTLGFVDKQGKTVIPFDYALKYYHDPYSSPLAFDSDSVVKVMHNGVFGKLHRNGTFTPDSIQ